MPWRKYPERRGKYGPRYKVANGIKVRRDHRRLWIVDINVNGKRKNKTIGAVGKAWSRPSGWPKSRQAGTNCNAKPACDG